MIPWLCFHYSETLCTPHPSSSQQVFLPVRESQTSPVKFPSAYAHKHNYQIFTDDLILASYHESFRTVLATLCCSKLSDDSVRNMQYSQTPPRNLFLEIAFPTVLFLPYPVTSYWGAPLRRRPPRNKLLWPRVQFLDCLTILKTSFQFTHLRHPSSIILVCFKQYLSNDAAFSWANFSNHESSVWPLPPLHFCSW